MGDQQQQSSIVDRLLQTQQDTDLSSSKRSKALSELLAEAGGTGELAEVRDALTGRFDAVSGQETHAESDVELLESLVDLTQQVDQRITTLTGRRDDLAARMSEVQANRPDPSPPESSASSDDDPHDSPAGGDTSPSETPAGDSSDTSSPSLAPGDETDRSGAAEVVAASAATTSTHTNGNGSPVPLNQMASNAQPGSGSPGYSILASADIPGIPAGSMLDGIRGLSHATTTRAQALTRLGPNTKSTVGVASIRRHNSEFVANGDDDVQVIDAACDERRLPGGSLLAAGNGFCSPSEYLYEFCPQPSLYGLVDLPTIVTPRGGVKYPVWTDPDTGNPIYPPAAADVGFHMTEEESKTETKPCMDIPCPEWEECRLELEGICVQAGILQRRTFPESIDDWMSRLLTAHAHKVNGWILAKMASLSTTVDVPAPSWQASGEAGPGGYVEPHGPGALQTVLSAVDNRAMHVRTKYWLGFDTTLEMVAPYWLVGLLRADISKKVGIQEWGATVSFIEQLFAARGIRIQWVMDWQDYWYANDPAGIGGANFANIWPSTIQIMLYPAGTFYRASLDIITQDVMYDSTLLKQNLFLQLFTEEGIQVCLRCYESTILQFHLCPNGTSGDMTHTYCEATPPPEGAVAEDAAESLSATTEASAAKASKKSSS